MTNVIARLERAHGAADGVNDAGAFMAVHRRIRALVIAVAGMQIGLAQAARHHAHDDFIGARLAELDGFDDERAGAFTDNGGFYLHAVTQDAL